MSPLTDTGRSSNAAPSASVSPRDVASIVRPLEQRALESLKRLRSATAFFRDLQSIEDTYAREFAALPLAIPNSVRVQFDECSELARVGLAFEAFVAQVSDVKAAVATDLALRVVAPMDKLLERQSKQTRRLLLDVAQTLQRERGLHDEFTKAARELTTESSNLRNDSDKNDNQSDRSSVGGGTGSERQAAARLRELYRQRDTERVALQRLLDNLSRLDHQQVALAHDTSERCVRVYTSMASQCRRLMAALHADVWGLQTRATLHNGVEDESECAWARCLESCERQVQFIKWMDAFFARLAHVEETAIKRQQTTFKLHSSTQVFPSSLVSQAGSFAAFVADLVHFHKLLTMNVLDPICRTLQFSAQKQTGVRKELVMALGDAAKLVQQASKKATALESKALASAGSAERRARIESASSASRAVVDAVKANLSNFGLRSAVATTRSWTQTLKQRTSLTDDDLTVDESWRGERGSVDCDTVAASKELHDARVRLASLQQSEAEQRREAIVTLYATSALGVKTIELVVRDFIKHMGGTVLMLEDRVATLDAALAAPSSPLATAADGARQSPAPKWRSLVRFPSDETETQGKYTNLLVKTVSDRSDEPAEGEGMDATGNWNQRGEHQPIPRRVDHARDEAGVHVPIVRSMCTMPKTQHCKTRAFVVAVAADVYASLQQCVLLVSKSPELRLVAVLAVCLVIAMAMALVVWCHVVRLSCRWEEVAMLQRSNGAALTLVLQRLQASMH